MTTELQFLFISALGYALALVLGLILVIAQRRALRDLTALVEQIRADKQLLDALERWNTSTAPATVRPRP
jgi:hypothetical protein